MTLNKKHTNNLTLIPGTIFSLFLYTEKRLALPFYLLTFCQYLQALGPNSRLSVPMKRREFRMRIQCLVNVANTNVLNIKNLF
jgi:hypothetical protein